MIGLYTKTGTLITNLVDNVVTSPDVIEVKNRTLDGQWHVQNVGTAATVANVKATLTLSEKAQLDAIKSISDLVKVIFDGKYYVGLIDGKPDYDRRKFPSGPMFVTSFTVLVREEGDAV